jgi:hypothetical protein
MSLPGNTQRFGMHEEVVYLSISGFFKTRMAPEPAALPFIRNLYRQRNRLAGF